uniref:PB1 domain-containing protein n=1 Tax=Lotharella oceanica TaxID=641309 RepID=A0A7S2U3R7_9EUKA|eukprot:CAMPEP_0170167798 /NCGR_PEP_ID=MMETSP0040_2-20121228/1097_1 /TAXON_ID=641309 /ORGANISM="Lotharella oceanica, Strain CCMP622" /LENGTH=434 /DNA_ID=CAMNT_0010405929 /DNA_START=15 /DNA_END=1319 /DNA_ORIENTATION=+
MADRIIKLVLGNGHVRRFKMPVPIRYNALRAQIAMVCRDLGAYDIFLMTKEELLPVRNDGDVQKCCDYALTQQSPNKKHAPIRLLIRKRGSSDQEYTEAKSPVCVQPSPFDEQYSTTLMEQTAETREEKYGSDCLSDPCPPMTEESDAFVTRSIMTDRSQIRDPRSSLREESMLVCRGVRDNGNGEVGCVLEKLESKLNVNMREIEKSITELEGASVQNVKTAAATCRSLVQVAENLKAAIEQMRGLKRTLATQALPMQPSQVKPMSHTLHTLDKVEVVSVTPTVVSLSEKTGGATASASQISAPILPSTVSSVRVERAGTEESIVTISSEHVQLVSDQKDLKAPKSEKTELSGSILSSSVDNKMKQSTGFVDLQKSEVTGRYEKQLNQLADMGFPNEQDLIFKKILLKLHNGDISKVVEDLRDYQKVGAQVGS